MMESCLNEEEVELIPQNVKLKLNEVIKKKDEELELCKIASEEFRVAADQKYFDLVNRLEESEKNLKEERSKYQQLDSIKDKLAKDVESLSTEHQTFQDLLKDYKSQLDVCKSECSSLSLEKESLLRLLEKHTAELEQTSAERVSEATKYDAVNKAKLEVVLKLDEVSSSHAVLQLQCSRLESEKASLNRRIDHLTNELTQTTTALYSARSEQTNKILELQTKLENCMEELRLAGEAKISLQTIVTEQNGKLEAQALQLREQRDANIQAESQFNQQLQGQIKLTDLYKTSMEEAQERVTEFTTAVEEMQKLLRQSVEDNKKLHESLNKDKTNQDAVLEEKDFHIRRLEDELVKANDLIHHARQQELTEAEIENLSPSAASASRLLKSGKSLTQIYSEYVELTAGLQVEKDMNVKLKIYLSQVLDEIEEKTPMIKQLREDYNSSLETVSVMTLQLNKAVTEREKMNSKFVELLRRCKEFESHNEELKRTNADLSQQICYLVKGVEEAKGNIVADGNEDSSEVTSTDCSSGSVVSDNLVNFRDIKELQSQNQKLLAVIRDLTEKCEREEQEINDKRISELQAELNKTLEEIAELRLARERESELVKSVIRQRDMYRVLLSQSSDGATALTSAGESSVGATSQMRAIPEKETASAMQQLQEDFAAYKTKTNENTKILDEQLGKLKEERMELRLQSAKIISQLEFTNERYNIVKDSVDGYKREVASLVSRNVHLASNCAKQDEALTSLRNDLLATQEKLSRSEILLDNARQDRAVLQQSEARLQSESEALRKERSGYGALLSNLQAIQNNLEKTDSDNKSLLTKRMSSLEKEVQSLRSKLDHEEERFRSASEVFEKERQDLYQKIQIEVEKHSKTRDELVIAYGSVHELRQELSSKGEKSKGAESPSLRPLTRLATKSQSPSLPAAQQENQDIALQLKETQAELSANQEQLQKLTEHLSQYKAMAAGLEEQLKEHNLTTKKFQNDTENMIKQKNDAVARLENELKVVAEEKYTLEKTLGETVSGNLEQDSKLRSDLNKATVDLRNAHDELQAAKISEEAAWQGCKDQTNLAKEAQQNYERELMLHAADVKALECARAELQGHNNKLHAAEDAKCQAEFALQSGKGSWEERETFLKGQMTLLESKCTDLENHNKLLHEQMERLSGQMVALQTRENKDSSFTLEEPDSKSNEDLMAVIRYLRKEKDIAVANRSVAVSENERLTTKILFLEKRLEDNSKMLNELQQKDQVSISTAAEHAEQLKKAELLNLLQDSNRLLRKERSSFESKIKELEAKSSQLEQCILPLQQENQLLRSQRDALQVERKALESEAKRWQSRTQHLVEQSSKNNPEEFKKALLEKEQFQKQASTTRDELLRTKSELSSLEANFAKVRRELETSKKDSLLKVKELSKQSEDLGVKDAQLAEINRNVQQLDAQLVESNKMVQQVRKIGRKYKAQHDELKVEYDALKAKYDEAEKKLLECGPQLEELRTMQEEQQLRAAAQEAGKLAESASAEAETAAQQLREKVALEEACQIARQEVKQELEALVTQAEAKATASEDKFQKLRRNAYQRLTALQTQKDEQGKELQELQAKIAAFGKDKEGSASQFNEHKTILESRVNSLERELEESKKSLRISTRDNSIAQKEIEESSQKLVQHQKLIETLQKQVKECQLKLSSSGGSSRDSSILSQSSADTVPPPTANIKPMATPTSVARHPHPSSGAPSRSTPLGRIRPITAVPSAAARTAAIPPTTATSSHAQQQQQMADAIEDLQPTMQSPSVPQASVAPTQVIAAAMAMVSGSNVAHDTLPHSTAAHPQSAVVHPSTSDDASTSGAPDIEGGSAHVTTDVLPDNLLEPEAPVTKSSLGKRTREDAGEAVGVTKMHKRVCAEEESRGNFPSTSFATPTAPHVVVQAVAPEPSVLQAAATTQDEFDRPDDDDLEIIFVEDEEGDCEDEGAVEEGSAALSTEHIIDDGEEEEEHGDAIEDDQDTDQYHEEFQDETSVDVIDEEQFGEQEDEEAVDMDDSEVEVIAEELQAIEEPSEDPAQQAESAESTPIQVQGSHSMFLPRIPHRSDRLPSLSRQHQGPSTGFEDGDSIVPSTPTLFDSRRNDGFAEAVSSPHVPPERFLFGSNVETPSQLASQGALGMDDTRMDLTQFDDGTGRSVPSTPLQVSPLETPSTELSLEVPSDPAGSSGSQVPEMSILSGTSQSNPIIMITTEDGNVVIDSNDGAGHVQEEGGQQELEAGAESGESEHSGLTIVEVSSVQDGDKEPGGQEEEGSKEGGEPSTSATGEGEGGSSQAQRRTTPIIWDRQLPSSRGGTVTVRGTAPASRGASSSIRGAGAAQRGAGASSRGGTPATNLSPREANLTMRGPHSGHHESSPRPPLLGDPFHRRPPRGGPNNQRTNFRFMGNRGRAGGRGRGGGYPQQQHHPHQM